MGLQESLSGSADGENTLSLSMTMRAILLLSESENTGLQCFFGGLTKIPFTSIVCTWTGKLSSDSATTTINL
jgi:hypothetical protein